MRYLSLTGGILRKQWLFTLIIVLETAALLVLTNTMMAAVNSKNMLYEPYRGLLQETGVVVDASNLYMMDCDNEEIMPFLEKYPDLKSVIAFLEERLGVHIHHTDVLSFVGMVGPHSTMYRDKGNTLTYYLLDQEILSKMHLPLSCGRFPADTRNNDGEIEIVVSGGTDATLNSVYDTPAGKMRVVGILTDSTYQPFGTGYDHTDRESGVDYDSIFNYCLPFDSQTNLGGPFAIAAKGVFPEDTERYNIVPSTIWLVTYIHDISEEAAQQTTDYLRTVGTIQYHQTLTTMREETERQINDIYYRMMPLIITAMIVVLSGLIGSTAISTLRQVRTFGIFFLCGCHRTNLLLIVCLEMLVTLPVSVLLAWGSILVMQQLGFEYLMGLTFGWSNLLVTVLLLLVLLVLSMILPFGIIKTTSPVKTIKECV